MSDDGTAYGPALPPQFGASQPEQPQPDDESGYDVIGPLAPGYEMSDELRHEKAASDRPVKEKSKREAWMLELPAELGPMAGVSARNFRRHGLDSKARKDWLRVPGQEDEAETEEESRKRKFEAIQARAVDERDSEMEKMVKDFHEGKKKKSLVELHDKKRKKKEKKEKKKEKKKAKKKEKERALSPSNWKPSRKPFDRDTDLNVNAFDAAMAKTALKNAQKLGGRFQSGSQKFL